ncbi:MAG: hypothetical protein ACEQSK_11775 [Sphingomonadaceae bacterium]
MHTAIYDKTAKGREEIATRHYQLAPRLRTLLVLIDGRKTEQELLHNVAGLGLTAASIAELLALGHIILATSYASITAAPEPTPPAPAPAPAPALAPAQQFQSLYEFYNKTIRSNIGLRGFTLQLKVEKAASVDDLRALRHPFLEAVIKAKGSDIARTLAEQLDRLLGNVPGNDGQLRSCD